MSSICVVHSPANRQGTIYFGDAHFYALIALYERF